MIRRILTGLWLVLAAAILMVVAVSHVAPALGYRVVIVSGGSMSPAIPIGSLLLEHPPARGGIIAGDVVTMTMPNGATITHRVTRLVDVDGTAWLETRGDANAEVDGSLVPVSAVSGVVTLHLPFAGLLLAFLGTWTGIIAILTALVALLFAIWIIEDDPARARRGTEAVDAPAS